MLYTVFFNVAFKDKDQAKMMNLKFNMKSKKWIIKTKNIEENDNLNNASRIFKIIAIYTSNGLTDQDILKSYQDLYLQQEEVRNTYFLEYIGLGPDTNNIVENEKLIETIND